MSIFPQIKFDKVTLTGGSKSIVVDNPHIDVANGPLLLREGVFNKRDNFYDVNIQLSAFENGTAIGPSGWLKNVQYIKYIKLAIFVSFYENLDKGMVPQNYTTNEILSLTSEKDKRKIANTIIYDSLGLTTTPYNVVTKPEQYEVFSFGQIINSTDDYIKFQDESGNYVIPLNLTLKFPKETEHLQIFAVPFLDLEALSIDYKLDITNTLQIKDILENPFYYTINVINKSKAQETDIVINNIIAEDVSNVNLKIPKDDILPSLNIDKNKVFNSTSISDLYYTKNELNQDVLFFFVNKKDLIIKNSPFSNSFIKNEIPQIIKQSLVNSTFTINLINDKKTISKQSNKLGSQILTTKDIDKSTDKKIINNLKFIENFIEDLDLYYFINDETKENNIINSYEIEIIIKDNLLQTLSSYYTILSLNLSQLQNYLKMVEIPYVKERTFSFNNPHIDLESTEREVTLPAFGFYDLSSNTIRNIELLEQQLIGLNNLTNNQYFDSTILDSVPTELFASKIENDLKNCLSFVIPLFSLDATILENLKVLNLIKPETASIETLNTIISIHKDILNSIGTVLDVYGILPKVSSDKSGGKKKAIIQYKYQFKQTICRNDYFNNFNLNKFVALRTNNAPYPLINSINANLPEIFTPQSMTLFGNSYDLMKEQNTKVNSDLARIIQYYYQLLNNNSEMTQDIYTMVNKEQKETESYSSFASLAFNEGGSDIVYTISYSQATSDLSEVRSKIDAFSYDFIYASKIKEKTETNDVNLIDKSNADVSLNEIKTQNISRNQMLQEKIKNKVIKKQKVFNVKVSDISEGIDQLLTQITIAPELNVSNISIAEILPQFKIETLVGFENNNLSLPIWQTLDKLELSNTASRLFCRLSIDTSQVQNKQLINKALDILQYPNKYFIVGTENA